MYWHATIIIILLARFSTAAWRNQTIDDDLGDSLTGFKVQYAPLTDSGGGAIWRTQDNCETCAILPDRAKTYNNTWTSATYFGGDGNYTAALRFHGTAIYIYFVISNYPQSTQIISAVQCNFRLDGTIVGSYTHQPDKSYIFDYNTLVYSEENLSNSTHNFIIEMARNGPSFVIFDYAQYTTDMLETTPTTTSSNSPSSSVSSTSLTNPPTGKRNIPAIIGGALGVFGSLACIALALFLWRRRREKKQGYQRDLQMQGLIDGDSLQAHISPHLLEEHAELAQQLRERTATQNGGMRTPLPVSALPVLMDAPTAIDDSDLRQEVVAMRLQLQRLETQQAATSTEPFAPYRDAVATAPAESTATRDSVFNMKREQTRALAAGSSASVAEVVIHTDSGVRLGAARRPIELPPTYALE
ncbi:hypothetical protein BD779DRAFT_107635 [Infundibulicybe gibba]|nr:hypothetical protein BD779DRAFT_107635 [Infundibulicybe gibba]